jgi:hypothetical protein
MANKKDIISEEIPATPIEEVADMANKKDIISEEIPATPIEEVADYAIIENFKGSPDGCTVIDFLAGSVMEMPASLASVAIAEGWAKPVKS